MGSRSGSWTKRCTKCRELFHGPAGSQHPTCPTCTPAKLLKPAQRRVLEILRDAELKDDQENSEIVCEGILCYIGLNRVHRETINGLLGVMAISDDSEEGSNLKRYSINETGRNILNDESQINTIYEMLRDGGAWTWENGKLVRMEEPGRDLAK